jgi:hypothetical protein
VWENLDEHRQLEQLVDGSDLLVIPAVDIRVVLEVKDQVIDAVLQDVERDEETHSVVDE